MNTPKLPKFLIADNSQEAIDILYVVHCETPKCIIQCGLDGIYDNTYIHWLDEEPKNEEVIESLLNDADEFLEDELTDPEMYDGEE